MIKDATPECKACFSRGQAAIKELLPLLKEAFPKGENFECSPVKQTVSCHWAIGEISFDLGDDCIRLIFKGIGGSTWNTRLANWTRYKVDISTYGRWNNAQVFEKAGKLPYEQVIKVITDRHQEYIDKQKAEDVAKTNRQTQDQIVAKMKPLTDEIRGYTRIECEYDGTFKLTLSSLDAGRLERILTALTIHHAK